MSDCDVTANVQHVRDAILTHAKAAGRDPAAITLIAVSKRQPLAKVFQAYGAGVRDFGENTIQGLQEKADAFAARGYHDVRWHCIGPLQRNKINTMLRYAHVLHTVDRTSLVESLSQRILQSQPPHGMLDVLVQVNIGREPQKSGVDPHDAVAFACTVARTPGLRLRGLMAIAPHMDHAEDAAPFFAAMHALHRQLRAMPEGAHADELSMGMSGDFAIAIRYGATMVRIGEGLFGARDVP